MLFGMFLVVIENTQCANWNMAVNWWDFFIFFFFFPSSPLHQILQSELTSLSRLVSSSCWPVLWDCLLPIKTIWNWNQSCCKDYRTECQLCVFLLGGTKNQESSCSSWRKVIFLFLAYLCIFIDISCSEGAAQHSLRQIAVMHVLLQLLLKAESVFM